MRMGTIRSSYPVDVLHCGIRSCNAEHRAPSASPLHPVRLSRGGCSFQFGRASAPTIPQLVQTMRGPKVDTATSSGQRSALSTAWVQFPTEAA